MSATSPVSLSGQQPEPPKLLVVDDEAAQMKALCHTLEHEGYRASGYTSALQALETVARGERFDLLLTDLMMPEMDGIALLQAVRERDADLVGVVMTGHGSIGTAIDAMKAGALDYILKPFRLRTVLPVLDRALAVRRLRLENAELQQRVQRHTRELEVANKELEAFSYSVSHDLRAPLRAVTGFAQILLEDHARELSQEAQRHLHTVAGSAQRMEQLIADLLEFSRLSRQPLNKQEIALSQVVEPVLAELRQAQPQRQVEIDIGELPQCPADASLLRQVFTNLLSNAYKFTRHRQPARIEIGCREQGDELLCFVRDNGAGFDMKYAGKLFGVFQRMHRVEDFEGTGIGLSIVHRIVQRHGGRVWAESEPDKGATFYFTLPK
jgi:hypothetical protein